MIEGSQLGILSLLASRHVLKSWLLRQLTASHLAKGGFALWGSGASGGFDPTEHLLSQTTKQTKQTKTDETEQTQKRPLTRMGAFDSLLRVLILALVTATVFISADPFGLDQRLSEDSSSDNSAANLQRQFSQERDRASVAIGGLTAAREPENVALTKQRELKQALDESEARSKALARELAETKQHADARQMELQEALD